jgi:hypothetical protein
MKLPLRFLLPPLAALLALGVLFHLQQGPARRAGAPVRGPLGAVEGAGAEAVPMPAAPGISPGGARMGFTAALTPARPGVPRVPAQADADALSAPVSVRPLPPDFLENLADEAGKRVQFTLPDGSTAAGTVTLRKADENGVLSIEGLLESPAPGHYFFQRQTAPGVAGAMVGFVRFDQSPKAWRIDPSGPGGAPVLNAVELDQLICVGKPLPPPGLAEAPAPAASPDAPGTPQFVPQAHPSTFPLPTAVNGVPGPFPVGAASREMPRPRELPTPRSRKSGSGSRRTTSLSISMSPRTGASMTRRPKTAVSMS